MRIDHLAFRVANSFKTTNFFKHALGYRNCPRIPKGFQVDFDDGTFAQCQVLIPPERIHQGMPWKILGNSSLKPLDRQIYYQPPEIFISEGSQGSIVDRWVKKHGNSLHHIALQVPNINEVKHEWEREGGLGFASERVLLCPGLKQIFSEPDDLTGVIWELIEREPDENGFCEENVRDLMLSTDAGYDGK